jgi:hypothetical protein
MEMDGNDELRGGSNDAVVVDKSMVVLSDNDSNDRMGIEVDNDKFNSSLDEFLDETPNSSLDEPVDSFALERVITGIKTNEDLVL